MNQNFMKEKPILPLVLSMALPMTISMLVNSLYNIVDSYFVAQISENAMTALSLVYPIQNIVTAVTVGFGIGINALVAFYLGAGQDI
ncbi:MAG: MATE family efflux transporter [Eubacterium sp.]